MICYSVLTALSVMVCMTLAQHLGLTSAIAKVISKVASCPMCSTFWGSLAILSFIGEELHISAMLSILVAYGSNWFVIVLLVLQEKYNQLWQRMTKRK